MAMMTAQGLRDIASKLANHAFVRYWFHWNYPQTVPWQMAIEIVRLNETTYEPVRVPDLDRMEFEWSDKDGRYYIYRDVAAEGIRID